MQTSEEPRQACKRAFAALAEITKKYYKYVGARDVCCRALGVHDCGGLNALCCMTLIPIYMRRYFLLFNPVVLTINVNLFAHHSPSK